MRDESVPGYLDRVHHQVGGVVEQLFDSATGNYRYRCEYYVDSAVRSVPDHSGGAAAGADSVGEVGLGLSWGAGGGWRGS